jgi:hypothetical protein
LPVENKGVNSKQVVLILSVFILVAAAAVALILYLNRPEEVLPAVAPTGGVRMMTEENIREIELENQEKLDRGMFETYMNTTWLFPDGKSPSENAIMGNSTSNNYPFYFTITVDNTGETVFTSGLLPVGSEISQVVLEKELAAGTYPATVRVNMVDENDQPVESNMDFAIMLVIQS